MSGKGLSIRNLRLSVADRVLFRDLSFELPERGLVGLMGPMGAGKSTLMTWLCGAADLSLVEGKAVEASVLGRPLGQGPRPALLPQKCVATATDAKARLSELASLGPPLLCVDEPTAQLTPADAAIVLEWLAQCARERLVLMISHNQLQVASFADQVMLVAGGALQEITPAKQFFTAPTSRAGLEFIGTGGTSVTSPDTDKRHLRSDLREVPADLEVGDNTDGDATLRWVVREKLAVFRPRRPGAPSRAELRGLADKGVSSIVVVDGSRPPDLMALADAGLVGVWFPMETDQMPGLGECKLLCQECDRLLKSGQKVAVLSSPESCDAERTVAAQLVHMGLPAGMAADVMRHAFEDRQLGVRDEQLLWDLELSNDLEVDDAGPGRKGRRPRTPGVAKGSIASFGVPAQAAGRSQ